MNFMRSVLLGICSIGFLVQPTAHKGGIELLLTGYFYPEEVTSPTGETWIGLFPKRDGYEAKQTQVRIFDSLCIDEPQRYVRANQPSEPIFLIRGSSRVHEGQVRTVFHGKMFLKPLQEIKFELSHKDPYELSASRDNANYLLTLEQHDDYQLLMSQKLDEENEPLVIWIGDLDDDNKLDFFIYTGPGTHGSEYALFLSSYAEHGKLVKKVATFSVVGD